MDGNQRWAKKNNLSLQKGYIAGFNNIKKIIDCCINNKINNITLYAASTENIKRSSSAVLFKIIRNSFQKFLSDIDTDKINFKIIGEKDNLPKDILDIFNNISQSKNAKINVNVAFNYATKYEIVNIINKIIRNNDEISIENIEKNMYLNKAEDPDILIRTGGFQRLSNFIMLNLAYTELFFSNTLWPDFTSDELNKIIKKFLKLQRNYGL